MMGEVKLPQSAGSRRTKLVAAGAGMLIVSGLAFSPVAFGAAAPPKYPAAEIHKPSPMPDRVMCCHPDHHAVGQPEGHLAGRDRRRVGAGPDP